MTSSRRLGTGSVEKRLCGLVPNFVVSKDSGSGRWSNNMEKSRGGWKGSLLESVLVPLPNFAVWKDSGSGRWGNKMQNKALG